MKKFKNQTELFAYIWETRPHISEVSGKPLLYPGSTKYHWQFAHILAKGHFPSYKLNPDNIMLMLPDEHERQEEFEYFIERKEELTRQYYKEVYGKDF